MIVTYEPNRWTMDFDTVMTEYSRMVIEDLPTSMDFDTVMTEYSRYEQDILAEEVDRVRQELEAIIEMELEFLDLKAAEIIRREREREQMIAESDFLATQGEEW